MRDAAAIKAPNRELPLISSARLRAVAPAFPDLSLAIASALLLTLSFPNFDLWPLAWVGLVPLILAVHHSQSVARAFVIGLVWGVTFFSATCWWLTYSMIHYGNVPTLLAYVFLVVATTIVAVFPGLTCALIAHLAGRFGPASVFIIPFIWITLEAARYAITGLGWNELGYSQAFQPNLIQGARWGGVHAVTFLILTSNVAISFVLIRSTVRALGVSLAVFFMLFILFKAEALPGSTRFSTTASNEVDSLLVVAVQPNVPMNVDDSAAQHALLDRHLELSASGLADRQESASSRRLVIWPESPMNIAYSRDAQLQTTIGNFARANHTAILLNSLEPAPDKGSFNSAILINEEGRIAAQYDKIRLMPFGEYVPLPRWLPGASSVRSIVGGEFKPGSSYTLMPLGAFRAGVFICIEAAHPGIARTFTNEGADVLINISNDGYLGPTAVMRQHLANAIFRAVENNRDVFRVTNTGITAMITGDGQVMDTTLGFEPAVRSWTITGRRTTSSFYSRHGDLFAELCAFVTLGFVAASMLPRRKHRPHTTIGRG